MKRLLFLHLRKTGGSTFAGLLKDFGGDGYLNINQSSVSVDRSELCEKLLNARVIEIHNLGIPFSSLFEAEWWSSFEKTLFKIVLIRNPCDQFASEFRYWHQNPGIAGFDLPFVPNIPEIDRLDLLAKRVGMLGLNGAGCIGSYFEQKQDEWMSLNDIVELQWQGFDGEGTDFADNFVASSPKGIESYSRFLDSLKSNAAYFDKSIDVSMSQLLDCWFSRNRQSSNVFAHFGQHFLGSPRLAPIHMDLVIPTEMLDFVIANLVVFKAPISSFFLDSLYSPELPVVFERIRSRIKNVTRKEYLEMDECKMSPSARFKFYLMNRFDFTIWQSSVKSAFDMVRALNV